MSNVKEEKKRPSSDGGIQVIARAISILRTLRSHPEGLSLSRLAQEVGLARSTVHRIVSSLEVEQFVVTASTTGGYRLGPALAVIGAAVSRSMHEQIRPFLEQLLLEVNETIVLTILDRDELVFIDQIAAPQRLRAVSGIGISFPLHCTANGKAILAKVEREQIGYLLPDPLPQLTPNTITNREQLDQELAKIRAAGVAFDCEEHTQGICAVGAAFRDPLGTLTAISIPVPSVRFYGNEQTIATALAKSCTQIQQHLASI